MALLLAGCPPAPSGDPDTGSPPGLDATTSTPENTLAACKDGIDNDGDGYTDCADQDCLVFSVCVIPPDAAVLTPSDAATLAVDAETARPDAAEPGPDAAEPGLDAATPPEIALTPTTLTFSAVAGGGSPASQEVAVTNSGAGTLAVPTTSIAYTTGTGWLTAFVTGSSEPYMVTAQVFPTSLSAGTYTATISVASTGASNSPQQIAVTLNLAPPCNHTCPSTGATQCSGDLVQTCTENSSGCRAWGAAANCTGGYCDSSQSKCVTCSNTCPLAGATQCSGYQVRNRCMSPVFAQG